MAGIAVLAAGVGATAAEATWPGWRGPRGDGTSLDEKVPLQWDADKDVLWKTALPGFGHAYILEIAPMLAERSKLARFSLATRLFALP